MATTIPAGTLRLLLTLISYRAKARKELRRQPHPCRWTAPPGGGCKITSRRADTVCDLPHCMAWIHNRGALLRPYIHYYNRAAALACTASERGGGILVYAGLRPGAVIRSSVAHVVYRRRVCMLYRVRWNMANQRKGHCKALCAVLHRGR